MPSQPRSDFCWSGLRNDDFTAFDPDQIHVGDALPALRACRSGLRELDLAVEPLHLDLPERGTNGFGLSLPGFFDGGGDGPDAVISAEAFGNARELKAALLPFLDEFSRPIGMRRRFRNPRSERGQMDG